MKSEEAMSNILLDNEISFIQDLEDLEFSDNLVEKITNIALQKDKKFIVKTIHFALNDSSQKAINEIILNFENIPLERAQLILDVLEKLPGKSYYKLINQKLLLSKPQVVKIVVKLLIKTGNIDDFWATKFKELFPVEDYYGLYLGDDFLESKKKFNKSLFTQDISFIKSLKQNVFSKVLQKKYTIVFLTLIVKD